MADVSLQPTPADLNDNPGDYRVPLAKVGSQDRASATLPEIASAAGGTTGGGSVTLVPIVTSGLQRAVIADAIAIAASSGDAQEITLTENLVAGRILVFNPTGSPGAYGMTFSDEILAKAAQAADPYNGVLGEAVPIKTHNPGDSNYGHETIYVWRSDEANKLWVKFGRSGAETLTVVRYAFNVDVRIDADSVSSVLAAVSLADAVEPTEDNVGLVQNIEGTLYIHDRSQHDGHGKTIGGTASPGTWITLNHVDFLGFYTHSHPPPDNEFTHGKFYYGRDYGSFLIHRVHGEGGFTGVTGNFTYDPFDDGEPWHEVTIAGVEVDLNFRGGVDHLRLAFAAANGVGEVFANRGENEIVYVSEFMAQSDGYDEFFRRIYIPPGVVRPIAEFWGSGQSEADPPDVVDRAITGGGVYYRYQWAQEEPNLVIGYDFGVRAVDAADVVGVDLIPVGDPAATNPAEAVLGNQRVLMFPAGQYRIHFHAAHLIDQNSLFGAWVFCVDPSADVIKRYSASGRADTPDASPLGAIVKANRIGQKIEFSKLLNLTSATYITIISGIFDGTIATAVNGYHSVSIEKLS